MVNYNNFSYIYCMWSPIYKYKKEVGNSPIPSKIFHIGKENGILPSTAGYGPGPEYTIYFAYHNYYNFQFL
jgi:hypothetical protein